MPLPCNVPDTPEPSFFEWYMYAAGVSKVPPEFHLWAGISAMAACLADRVWFEKFRGEKLTPNLYVMLIGPSGIGKNQAIRRAQKLVEAIRYPERVQVYRGKITAQQLLTRLSKQKKLGNFLWLVTPELAMQVGNGPKAEDFVTHMTELYDSDTTVQDDTRTSGHFLVERPCINWLPGSTREWLFHSVGKRDVLGGFFARILAIPGERAASRLGLAKPIFPSDFDSIWEFMVNYLGDVSWLEGQVTLSDDADALHDWWYENQPPPTNELLWHFYEHGDNLVLKLAMILAVADDYKMVIEYAHMDGAIALYEWVYARLASVLEFAHMTPEGERLSMIRERLLRAGGSYIGHAELLRFATSRGFNKTTFTEAVNTLVATHEVSVGQLGRGRAYRYAPANGAPSAPVAP